MKDLKKAHKTTKTNDQNCHEIRNEETKLDKKSLWKSFKVGIV